VRLWALRHRCWHLPRERRTPWRAAGHEEGRAAVGAAAKGGAAGPVGGPGAGGRGGRDGNAEERKGDKTARGPSCRARQRGSGPKHRGRASP
jgi:hypothetical protein